MEKKFAVYDIETLKNLITLCFLDYKTKKRKQFVLYNNIVEFHALVAFLKKLKKSKYYLVGFNCVAFDAQIIEEIFAIDKEMSLYQYNTKQIIDILYNRAQTVINVPIEEKFTTLIPEWKFNIPHIDVYRQKHYDRMQKATSLKWVQFTMRYPTVEEMPIEHDAIVTEDQIPEILEYNWNDVDSTAQFFEKIMFETDLRFSLSEKFDLKLLNAAEPKMARDIFGKFLCEEMNIPYKELKTKKTTYDKIVVNDIIFPYIHFKENEIFKGLLKELQEMVLTPDQKWKKKSLNVYGLDATIGLGGIHSENKPTIVKEDDKNIIMSSDVASMYPNLAIQNGLKPAHLGNAFSKVYQSLYEERKKYDKKDPINYVYKIILNSAYGLSSEKNTYLYDVSYTRATCLNGELSLLMLCEALKMKIPKIQFIMLNTDGLEALIPREDKDKYMEACAEWEQVTKLVLEHAQYSKMVISDCNNYIAVDTKGGVKKKGRFDTNIEYHKNPSFLIIAKALEQYFVNGIDYHDYINPNCDPYDFLGAVKQKSDFKLKLSYVKNGEIAEIDGQKVTRFYIAKEGKTMRKDYYDGRKVGVLVDWELELANKMDEEKAEEIKKNINLSYYWTECAKIVQEIEKNTAQLSLVF